jgi:hypothetical protein
VCSVEDTFFSDKKMSTRSKFQEILASADVADTKEGNEDVESKAPADAMKFDVQAPNVSSGAPAPASVLGMGEVSVVSRRSLTLRVVLFDSNIYCLLCVCLLSLIYISHHHPFCYPASTSMFTSGADFRRCHAFKSVHSR